MFYRILLGLIAALWLTMWTLLIRSELQPAGAGIRSLPVEHVLKEIFRHDQPSELWIRDNGNRIGHLRLAPKTGDLDGPRSLEFFGNLQLDLPGAQTHRAVWDGNLVLDREWRLESLHLSVHTRAAAARINETTR